MKVKTMMAAASALALTSSAFAGGLGEPQVTQQIRGPWYAGLAAVYANNGGNSTQVTSSATQTSLTNYINNNQWGGKIYGGYLFKPWGPVTMGIELAVTHPQNVIIDAYTSGYDPKVDTMSQRFWIIDMDAIAMLPIVGKWYVSGKFGATLFQEKDYSNDLHNFGKLPSDTVSSGSGWNNGYNFGLGLGYGFSNGLDLNVGYTSYQDSNVPNFWSLGAKYTFNS